MDDNLRQLLEQIAGMKAEVDGLRPLPAHLEEQTFQKFRLDWNYHSNAIEGNKLTLAETTTLLLEGLTAQGKPLKDHLDIKGHNHVIDFLLQFIRRKEELTEVTIREMHRVLLVEPYEVEAVTAGGQPAKKMISLGEYKTSPNQVTTSTGEVHRYASPEETPVLMHDLLQWYRAHRDQEHPLIVASVVHYRFAAIHPFDDGNGRMARVLMNLVLMWAGFPPIVIKTTDREAYFGALVKADQGDLAPIHLFMARKLIDSLELYSRGGRGEALEEPEDIDKQIALLKQELSKEPDRIPYSQETYRKVLQTSLLPLSEKFLRKICQFDDLFLDAKCWVQFEQGAKQNAVAARKEDRYAMLTSLLEKSERRDICIGYNLVSFKKAGVHSFDCTTSFRIVFKGFTYEVSWLQRKTEHLYSTSLRDDQTTEIVNALISSVLRTIEQERVKKG